MYEAWANTYGGEGYRLPPGMLEQEMFGVVLGVLSGDGDGGCDWGRLGEFLEESLEVYRKLYEYVTVKKETKVAKKPNQQLFRSKTAV